ncbi:hypothetical protein [Amycolatopsis sp. PS_44_ISF1]|uniref:hypothetical protein n=1 Tax=Amycolatopsis sp. PS_44_ISF1 TaxID=2974917 RepID=UPI0028DFEAAC|nr:hypothetical protein [Amycolatopsis sp. PS_44_ISF1]MDT8912058.1 hypothetical protein [Amycolatopsis sp. PS_44_ISF1]
MPSPSPVTWIVAAAAATMLLSACSGQQSGEPATPASASAQARTGGESDVCASATPATLGTAVKANKQIADAVTIDEKGLQDIKCKNPWAVARFSNGIDGGAVLFTHRNSSWVAENAGSDVCADLPAATAKQLCG